MPTYSFRNINTGEIEEHIMKIAEQEDFKKNNPHLEKVIIDTVGFGDANRMSLPKYGKGVSAFEHGIIDRIKNTVPGNTLAKSHKTKAPKWE